MLIHVDLLQLLRSKGNPVDYTVIVRQRQHIGDEPGFFGDDIPLVGRLGLYSFDCPGIDRTQEAVLTFQALNVDSERNLLTINGIIVFGGVPKTTSTPGGWSAQSLLVRPSTLLEDGNNLLLDARTTEGSTTGNIDDFLVDNVVLFYKTR